MFNQDLSDEFQDDERSAQLLNDLNNSEQNHQLHVQLHTKYLQSESIVNFRQVASLKSKIKKLWVLISTMLVLLLASVLINMYNAKLYNQKVEEVVHECARVIIEREQSRDLAQHSASELRE